MARPKTNKTLPRLNYTLRNKCIYYVVAHNGQFATPKSTGLRIENGQRWNKTTREVVGNEAATQTLKRLDYELLSTFDTMSRNGQTVTAQSLFDSLNNKRDLKSQIPGLVGAIDAHIATKKPLRDIGQYHPKSYRDLSARKVHVIDFLKHQYKCPDIALAELKPNLGNEFDLFLRTKKGHKSETIRKVTNFLSSVLKHAYQKEWIGRNVMDNYKKPNREITEPNTLTAQEINQLKALDISEPTTNAVRWQFVFMCYTALNHVDLGKLTTKDLVLDKDGDLCIKRGRSKTTKTTFIPLKEVPLSVIDQFKEHAQKTGYVFPVLSIDKFNKHLKIIQGIWQFKRFTLTTKIGRSTCATLLGSEGMNNEGIMQVTGHTKPETLRNSYLESSRINVKKAYNQAFNSLNL